MSFRIYEKSVKFGCGCISFFASIFIQDNVPSKLVKQFFEDKNLEDMSKVGSKYILSQMKTFGRSSAIMFVLGHRQQWQLRSKARLLHAGGFVDKFAGMIDWAFTFSLRPLRCREGFSQISCRLFFIILFSSFWNCRNFFECINRYTKSYEFFYFSLSLYGLPNFLFLLWCWL